LLKPKAQCAMTLLKMGDKVPETSKLVSYEDIKELYQMEYMCTA
jgi:hypothetical protein